MDLLSLALQQIKTQTYVSSGFKADGRWAVKFPQYEGIKFNTVRIGHCFISIEGENKIHEFRAGDCFLLTSGKPFTLASNLKAKPLDANVLFKNPQNGVVKCNGGKDFFLIGARFSFSSEISSFLFRNLPSVIRVNSDSVQAPVMSWGLEQFDKEFQATQHGRQLILEHLLQFMLVYSLRYYIDSNPSRSGWLAALSDKNLIGAIDLIHKDLRINWKVEELADAVGMSRSAFALKFKKRMQLSPVTYSRNWKMLVAQKLLADSSATIAEIADKIGYESESSFRLAFKRFSKIAPGEFRRLSSGE